MKFYEKIIGINKDAPADPELTITFSNNGFEFNNNLYLAAGKRLSISGDEGSSISFRGAGADPMIIYRNIEDNGLEFVSNGKSLQFNFSNQSNSTGGTIYANDWILGGSYSPLNTIYSTKGFFNSLSPTGNNPSIGAYNNRWVDIFSTALYTTNANITNANITNANIYNISGIDADGYAATLKLPRLSEIKTINSSVRLMGGDINSITTTITGGIKRYYVGNWYTTGDQVTWKRIELDSGGSGMKITQFFAKIDYNGLGGTSLLIPLPVTWKASDMFFLNDANIGHTAKNARACPYDEDNQYIKIAWDNTQETSVLFYLQMVRFSI